MGSLKDTTNLARLAEHLYDYLPGSSAWGGVFTFQHAAGEAGVPEFWMGGSKLPALTGLLDQTYRSRRRRFCPLILVIVREGIKYRAKKSNPMTQADLDTLNGIIKALGFKIADLWDPGFRESLVETEKPETDAAPEPTSQPDEAAARRTERLAELRGRFLELQGISDRQAAGRMLEPVLTELFEEYGLEPRGGFRITGEQIDGSFLLHKEVYLVEAKWTGRVPEAELLVFRGKVQGKATFTRGLFLSVNGYSGEALESITRGKQPNFVMMDGAHLFRVLSGDIGLDDLLDRLVRILAEEGRPYLPVSELSSLIGRL
ncbi:MAG: hypothetical protein ABIK83_14165 [Candidatus Zixiibacteriota bacterium]